MSKLQLANPLKSNTILQLFGVNGDWYRSQGVNIKGHNGIDFQTFHGEPIYATHDGLALYQVDERQGHGVVVITQEKHDYLGSLEFGYEGGNAFMKTIYWHMCDPIKEPKFKSPLADKGAQPVKVGDILGYADSTGFSTGDHLHFATKPVMQGENLWTWGAIMKDNGYSGCIDPLPYFIDQTNFIHELQLKKISLIKQALFLAKEILRLLQFRK